MGRYPDFLKVSHSLSILTGKTSGSAPVVCLDLVVDLYMSRTKAHIRRDERKR